MQKPRGTLKIKWQRLVSNDKTCERCGLTKKEVDEAVTKLNQSLKPLGIDVNLEKETLSLEEFKKNPKTSNKITINEKPLENWIDAETSQSECCDVCGDEDCRTVIVEDKEYEVVPANLIINAGLNAAAQISKGKSCCTTTNEENCCCG
ncbi:MAG: DUF2703 domain-containing protein [Hadesarchaea archaeon]|nr:DUF2703 domain-containing protein [Hadesarchaea archaeon]